MLSTRHAPSRRVCVSCLRSHRRSNFTIARVASQTVVTQKHLDARQPQSIKRIKPFQGVPPSDLKGHMFDHLQKVHGNPRSILKVYREYIKTTDHPDPIWLIRCFCQLGNVFGFNSFWSTKDKQILQKIPIFKYLVFDLIEVKDQILPRHAPRLLYAMSALEYRSRHLLPTVLGVIENSLGSYRLATLAHVAACLAHLGVGGEDSDEANSFDDSKKGETASVSSKGESSRRSCRGLVGRIMREVQKRYTGTQMISRDGDLLGDFVQEDEEATPFCWAALAHSLVVFNMYDWSSSENAPRLLPVLLRRACEAVESVEDLDNAGWVQYYLYLSLYCADVEKPGSEELIKRAIPLPFQERLHLNWLKGPLLHAQPQGSERLQMEFGESLERLRVSNALLNCSAGRPWDEQHCFFAGYLIQSKDLAILFNHQMALGPGSELTSGADQLKARILRKFGLNVVTVHKGIWDGLDDDRRDALVTRMLAAFPTLRPQQDRPAEKAEFRADKENLHRRKFNVRFQKWPIQVLQV